MRKATNGSQGMGFATLRIGDIVVGIDGRPIDSRPILAFHLYTRSAGRPISSVAELRTRLDVLKPRSPVVLQIERDGLFTFAAFELD